jgi:hypothetical protein
MSRTKVASGKSAVCVSIHVFSVLSSAKIHAYALPACWPKKWGR